MKNFFQWEYNYDSFQQKDDKCLQNTDHTTGNAFDHIHDDPFNNESQLILNQNEERMIHCHDQDQYLNNSQNEAQDLQFFQEDQEKQIKAQTPETHKKEQFYIKETLTHTITEDNLTINQFQQPTEIIKDAQIHLQKCPQYKLSRKWKQKMKSILQQKSIHQFSAKHNRNMAKFFVRLFSKYLKLLPQKEQFSIEIQCKLRQILEKNCISLKDLESLFGVENSGTSRQFLSKILRTKLKQEVIKSQDVQNKEAYLLCSKVYALRCRSRHLIGRLQSR